MGYPLEEINFRNFDSLMPTNAILDYVCEEAHPPLVEEWVVRLVRQDGDYRPDDLIIEFYSADTNQFVSSYYLDTFMGEDEWGGGYGHGLDLWGDVDAWKISAYDTDAIRDWCEEVRYDV